MHTQTLRDSGYVTGLGTRRGLAWPAGFAVAGLLLFTAFLLQTGRGTYVNSDGGSNALQAWAMLHGNLLLHGWTVSDVSFYTTELPEYMLVELVRGLSPDVVHICGALSYTLLVLLAAAVAKGRDNSKMGLVRALIAGGIMLAPQLGRQTALLMLNPDHVGTGVPLLAVWLLVDRGEEYSRGGAGWRRWLVPAAVGLLLAWTIVGDQIAEVIGALPLALACLTRTVVSLVRDRRGLTPGTQGARRYELSLAIAAIGSVPLAMLGFKIIAWAGGWTISPFRTQFISDAAVLRHHVYLTGTGILDLFGANFLGQQGAEAMFAWLHLTGLALAAAGLVLAARRFLGEQVLLPVLVTGIAVNIAAYLLTVQARDSASTREIAAVLAFGAVLAGRTVPDLVTGLTSTAGQAAVRIAAALGCAVLAGYAAILGYHTTIPQTAGQPAQIAGWLARHHLTRGLGGYWQSSSVTVDSGGAVQVRPIAINNGKLMNVAYWEADAAWFDPATQYANFIVNAPPPFRPRYPGQLVLAMEALAGKPDRIYHADGYTIAVWHQNLLAKLR